MELLLKTSNIEAVNEEDEGFGSPRLKMKENNPSPPKKKRISIANKSFDEEKENDMKGKENDEIEVFTPKNDNKLVLRPSSAEPKEQKKDKEQKRRHLSTQLQLAKSLSIENIRALPEMKNKSFTHLKPIQEDEQTTTVSSPLPVFKIYGKEKEGFTVKKLSREDVIGSNSSPIHKNILNNNTINKPQQNNGDKFSAWGKNKANNNKKKAESRPHSFNDPSGASKEVFGISSKRESFMINISKSSSLIERSKNKHRTILPQLSENNNKRRSIDVQFFTKDDDI